MRPFRSDFDRVKFDDLRCRVGDARFPAPVPAQGWERGTPPAYLRGLAAYWRDGYDWRRTQQKLNSFPQFVTEIDGVDIHFLHVQSPEPDATPVILTHGWPGSVLEFLDVIGPLTDPRSHGGDAGAAVHLVIPSIPGFGFSGAPQEPGWDLTRIAFAWAELMRRLGYDGYVPQGGDIGAWISLTLAAIDAPHVSGAHVNFLVTPPGPDPESLAGLGPDDFARLQRLGAFATDGAGYMAIQSTRPQSLSYGLTDSPVGLLGWMVEKFFAWSGATLSPEDVLTRDQMLDQVSLYWLTETVASSANLYYEIASILPTAPTPPPLPPPLDVPLGVAVYAGDVVLPVRVLAERQYSNIVHWREFDQGGHFPAMERPTDFVSDLHEFVRALKPVGVR